MTIFSKHRPALRDRVVVWAANRVLGLATPHYRMMIRGSILYGLRSAAEDTERERLP